MSPASDAGAPRRFGPLGQAFRSSGLALLSVAALLAGARGTQDAVANGDTRTISIHHMHTREATTVTFRRDGRYVAEALDQLNHALRDWRNDDKIRMDPRLFDIAWEVHRETGSSSPFHVVSAYRSPGTNAMLRRRSRGVAKHSQHMEGKAMDFYLPDVSSATIRAVGMKLQRGGVGYYPTSNTPFVHLDVGSVRSWPRMTRDQLARLFPNGDTVHIAADGRPLEGYEVAKAQILARGGSVGGYASGDFDEGAIMQGSRRSLWASLFGWNEEEEVAPARGRAARGRSAQQQTLAYAPSSSGDSADMYGVFRRTPAEAPAAQSIPLRPRAAEPVIAAAPVPSAAPATAPVPATPAAPPAPRLVAAPFPAARPADLTGPIQLASIAPGSAGQRLNWQQGPGSASAGGAAGAAQAAPVAEANIAAQAGRMVLAPLPPRRPGDAPPVHLAAAPAATPPGPGRLVVVSHPAPPERPRLASVPPISASPRPAAPAGPLVPPSDPPPAIAQPSLPAPSDRQALDNLFAAVATGALPNSATRVTTTRARTAQPQPGALNAEPAPAASLGFSQREPNDTRADRFSGPAVRPLPATYTSR